ncbi:hypothetical protein IWQ57_002266 [Coemansia nantahalensis]|uniref:Uncharacterized protein n=1 Tax=Coemansia nantahalensis TaxID=2789366 RepID=A0ACC1K1V0_9FUNG|nr:hypothetical protein IWQ57_002266 [Coemansia nantahalensis]
MAVLRIKLLVALPLAAVAIVSSYLLLAGVPPHLRQLMAGQNAGLAEPQAMPASAKVAYFLPVAGFTDSKWLRMNTVLNKAVKVCDTETLKQADNTTAAKVACDITLETKSGWANLCSKTELLFDHLCTLEDYGVGDSEFIVKIDDDAIADPDLEKYMATTMRGKDVFFGSIPGFKTAMTGPYMWYGGAFYGFNAGFMKRVCACNRPKCKPRMGEDQWAGVMLGECNITKEDILLPDGYVYHREYSVPRVSVKFQRYF